MRPYQIYAVKAIVDCIHQNRGNGFIWHTTGSGKTLTSFKASTLLKDNPDIEKCLFVVDRKDLDRQTREEFNKFQEGTLAEDFRFKSYGLAPKSAADFAFLLHGFHFLGKEGTMAIILPHGVLFRGGAEERIRTKLLKDNNIDAVIGLPSNLFYSTGIPVCILVLKKCKKDDDVLFINASEYYDKGKRQNALDEIHIKNIVETYQYRQETERYSRKVSMDEIEHNDYNLNISRYVSTAKEEVNISLEEVNIKLTAINESIKANTDKHNAFLKELGLKTI
nr:N-6 DNA methylase [Mucilaginibacter endophyticus]